jgi:hypothetical protein
MVIDAEPLPQLRLADAVRRLDAGVLPFLAFVTTTSGRAAVLYRPFDGHLGIVTPIW